MNSKKDADFASLRAAFLMPVLLCLFAIELVSVVLIILILLDIMSSEKIFLSAAVTAGALCTVALVVVLRLYKPLGQFDAVMERIAHELQLEEGLPRTSARHRVNIASSNIEWLFDRYVAAVNKEYVGELLARQAQFRTLQSQINPHFLYNTLESLRGHALAEGVPEIADMAEALSHFFRYSISQMGDFVTVQQELDNVQDYFRIQKYRFGNRLNLVINYDTADPLERYYMPKLTLQPIVENCIYHGFDSKVGPGTVTIRIVLTQSNIILYVRDDGIGMDTDALERLRDSLVMEPGLCNGAAKPHKGLALYNVNQRIKMFFGPEYGLYISSTPMVGTNVEIVIPTVTEPPELEKDLFIETGVSL